MINLGQRQLNYLFFLCQFCDKRAPCLSWKNIVKTLGPFCLSVCTLAMATQLNCRGVFWIDDHPLYIIFPHLYENGENKEALATSLWIDTSCSLSILSNLPITNLALQEFKDLANILSHPRPNHLLDKPEFSLSDIVQIS